jgi:polyhydroxyalkanoate synthesis regulator phasin
VQDLEHQLYEAKLTQYESAKVASDAGPEDSDAHSEDGSEDSQGEDEAPNTSVMQEMTAEERAKFEDLKSANAKIDELEAEVSRLCACIFAPLWRTCAYCHRCDELGT